MTQRISPGRPSWSMVVPWRCGRLGLRCLNDWQDGAASVPAGHSRPTLDYKTFPAVALRYTPGGHPGAHTHARGGRIPHLAGCEIGSAQSEKPRQPSKSPPRAVAVQKGAAAKKKKSAKISL